MDKFILNKEETALLIIDIQEKLVPVMKYKNQVINNTKILINAAIQMNMPIIYTEQYPKGLGKTVTELEELLMDATKFEKNSFTAYIEDVRKALKASGRKKIIVVGMENHVCVYQTVRDLIIDEFQVFLVKDAVASRTKMNYRNGLDLMNLMGAVITNTETVVFDLLKTAGTPEFKVLSKLIK